VCGAVPVVMPALMFGAARFTEGRYPLEVTDDTGAVIDVAAATGGAGLQRTFIDVLAAIAQGDADINTKVVTTGFSGEVQQSQIAGGRQFFFEVQMQR